MCLQYTHFHFFSKANEDNLMKSMHFALWDVTNYDIAQVILLEDDDGDHSKSWIWNGIDSNNITSVHKAVTLSFIIVICYTSCWIMMHYL